MERGRKGGETERHGEEAGRVCSESHFKDLAIHL